MVFILGCGGSSPPQRSDLTQPPSPLVGAWTGTKTYFDADGDWIASAPEWYFEITSTGPGTVAFVNGPSASVNGIDITINAFEYPAGYTPGGPGHCGPSQKRIVSGSGTLSADGVLSLDIHFTISCGGATAQQRATYEMTRLDAPNSIYFPGL
jgi:hypothetical protein